VFFSGGEGVDSLSPLENLNKLKALRALRVLRALRLLSHNPELQLVRRPPTNSDAKKLRIGR
jgi:hypothetical protein